jgi:hypothetical protein
MLNRKQTRRLNRRLNKWLVECLDKLEYLLTEINQFTPIFFKLNTGWILW